MAQRRRRRELELLYRTRYESFVRVAQAIVGDDADARDAVQEGFARALKGLAGFRGEGSMEGWVFRIVINAARAVGSDRQLLAEPLDREAPELTAADEEVRRWIGLLPERQRLAVFLRYYADLEYRAIAAALEIEPGTVSATLSAAHTALRRQMQEVRP